MTSLLQLVSLLVKVFVVLLVLSTFIIPAITAATTTDHHQYVSDNCDWQGSGSLNADSDRSVVPIYLRCSRGTVQWLYPKGGLRVVLKFGSYNKDFRGCIRVARNSSSNVRIYLEGKRQLHQIYAKDDGRHPDQLRCFVSVNGFMALFIETDSRGLATQNQEHITFSYDLETSLHPSTDIEWHDCQPCSDQTLLNLFCMADFVLTGKVTYFHHQPEVEMTEFVVQPSFIYRYQIEDSYLSDYNATSYRFVSPTFESEENTVEEMRQMERVNLHRHQKCNSRAEPMVEYLFMGQRTLGYYIIKCAPKLSYWQRIAKQAIEEGTNQCHIP